MPMSNRATTKLSRKCMNIIQKMPFFSPVISGKLYCSIERAPVYCQPAIAGLPLRSHTRVRSPMRRLATIPSDLSSFAVELWNTDKLRNAQP
jgi:hypothetical protein